MAKEVIMPKFGFTQEESQVVEWLVKDGDTVEAGDPLLEVTTDKVNMEVESPATGIVGGIRVAAGDTVPVTEIIAYILAPGEAAARVAPAYCNSGPARDTGTAPRSPSPGYHAVAARMAAETGIDLDAVPGSGRGGRVTRNDSPVTCPQPRPTPEAAGNGKVAGHPRRPSPGSRARHRTQRHLRQWSRISGSRLPT